MCGDLYPDSLERSVLLPAIEQYIGPPSAGQHWYAWEAFGKKHKGSGVSDLEKARRAPTQWGVTAKCNPGRLRPSRPVRRPAEPSPLQIKTGPSALSPEAIDTESLEGSGGEQGSVDNSEEIRHPFEEDPFEEDPFKDLQSEDDILQRCKELETKVEGLRAKQAKMAEEKKKALKEVKDKAKAVAEEKKKALKEVKDKAKAVAKAVANAKDGAPGGKGTTGGGALQERSPSKDNKEAETGKKRKNEDSEQVATS
jgi:hypothetical protein